MTRYNQHRCYLVLFLALISGGCSEQKVDKVASENQRQVKKYPSCRIEKTAELHFRNNTEKDSLRIEIAGNPCYEATLRILIKTKNGKDLYRYEAPFKPHTAVPWEDIEVPKDPEALINRILVEGPKASANLPPYLPKEEFYGKYYNELVIDRDSYEHLRISGRPVFWHPTHYEEWSYVVYDEKQEKGIVFMKGGL